MRQTTKTNTVFFSVKGQVVIPHWLRREFQIEEGIRAYVSATPQGILIQPVTAKHIRSLRGLLKGSKAIDVLMAVCKKARGL